jgi:hypothetical protein
MALDGLPHPGHAEPRRDGGSPQAGRADPLQQGPHIFADPENASEAEILAFKNEFRELRRSGEVSEVTAALPEVIRKAG